MKKKSAPKLVQKYFDCSQKLWVPSGWQGRAPPATRWSPAAPQPPSRPGSPVFHCHWFTLFIHNLILTLIRSFSKKTKRQCENFCRHTHGLITFDFAHFIEIDSTAHAQFNSHIRACARAKIQLARLDGKCVVCGIFWLRAIWHFEGQLVYFLVFRVEIQHIWCCFYWYCLYEVSQYF